MVVRSWVDARGGAPTDAQQASSVDCAALRYAPGCGRFIAASSMVSRATALMSLLRRDAVGADSV